MKKLMILRIIGCVLFLSLILYPANSLVYIADGNIFDKLFTEPVEIMYIIFYDGYLLRFTTYHENKIEMLYPVFKQVINEKGYKIKDIVITIHNHLPGYSLTFTDGDMYFLRRMRGDGFKGSFCLWYNHKVRECERYSDE